MKCYLMCTLVSARSDGTNLPMFNDLEPPILDNLYGLNNECNELKFGPDFFITKNAFSAKDWTLVP